MTTRQGGAHSVLGGNAGDRLGLLAHDSDGWTLERFSGPFGAGYRPLRVGEEFVL